MTHLYNPTSTGDMDAIENAVLAYMKREHLGLYWTDSLMGAGGADLVALIAFIDATLRDARRVHTVDELDALPVGTVVLADGDVYVSYDNLLTTWREWIYPGDDDPQQSIPLPARILHLPDSKDPS